MINEPYLHNTLPLADILGTKPFFKIGEVAKFLGVKPHVLRYWEAEFPSLKPRKNPSGQRIYAKADIEAIVEIQNLLYNRRYTISGAKKMLTQPGTTERHPPVLPTQQSVCHEFAVLKQQLQDLVALVQGPVEHEAGRGAAW